MGEVRMFNHGIFQEHLVSKIEELQIKKKDSKDPYEQWNFDEQIKLTTSLLEDYKKSVEEQLR